MREMTPEETTAFIAHNHLGVLSLADEGRAYGIPLYYATDGRSIFFQTRPGLKQRYAVATREACFTIVRVMAVDDWASAHVFGSLTRMEPDLGAQDALMRVPMPPSWGEGPRGVPERPDQGAVLYRLDVARVSGRYSRSPQDLRKEAEILQDGM